MSKGHSHSWRAAVNDTVKCWNGKCIFNRRQRNWFSTDFNEIRRTMKVFGVLWQMHRRSWFQIQFLSTFSKPLGSFVFFLLASNATFTICGNCTSLTTMPTECNCSKVNSSLETKRTVLCSTKCINLNLYLWESRIEYGFDVFTETA